MSGRTSQYSDTMSVAYYYAQQAAQYAAQQAAQSDDSVNSDNSFSGTDGYGYSPEVPGTGGDTGSGGQISVSAGFPVGLLLVIGLLILLFRR